MSRINYQPKQRAPPKDIITLIAETKKEKCDICGIVVSDINQDMSIDPFLYPLNYTRRDKQVCNFCLEAEEQLQYEQYQKYIKEHQAEWAEKRKKHLEEYEQTLQEILIKHGY